MKPVTKEALAELIELADMLAEKLKDMEYRSLAEDAANLSHNLRYKFDRICGEEEMKRIREQKIKN